MSDEEKKAIEYLKENLKNWKDTRPSLSNTDIVEEVDKDYKAIETLLTAYEKEKEKAEYENELRIKYQRRYDSVKEKNKKAKEFIDDKNNYFEDGENWQNILKIKEILKGGIKRC